MTEQQPPPVEAILAEVLTLRAFCRSLEQRCTDWPVTRGCLSFWLATHLLPHFPPPPAYRLFVMTPNKYQSLDGESVAVLIDGMIWRCPDWLRAWFTGWQSAHLTAQEALNTLLYGTIIKPEENS